MRVIEDLEFLNGLPVEKKFPAQRTESLEENPEDVIEEASREEDEIESRSFNDDDDDDFERGEAIDLDIPGTVSGFQANSSSPLD